jgi:hypothetical protein
MMRSLLPLPCEGTVIGRHHNVDGTMAIGEAEEAVVVVEDSGMEGDGITGSEGGLSIGEVQRPLVPFH